MAEVLALPLLFDAVVAQFASDAAAAALPNAPPNPPAVAFLFGWKEVAKQMNYGPGGSSRIVFAPGDEGFKFAEDLPPHGIGRDPRPIATEEEYFTVYIAGHDGASPDVERNQYTATRLLYDAWRRAIYNVTHTNGDTGIGPLKIVSQRWNRAKLERSYGAELVVVCSVQAMVPDEDGYQIVDPPIHSNTTITELDQSVVVTT